MTTVSPYELSTAGINAFDVFTKEGRFAGMVVQNKRGHWTHYYNSNATKGSSVKFVTIWNALANIDKRRARIAAKRTA